MHRARQRARSAAEPRVSTPRLLPSESTRKSANDGTQSSISFVELRRVAEQQLGGVADGRQRDRRGLPLVRCGGTERVAPAAAQMEAARRRRLHVQYKARATWEQTWSIRFFQFTIDSAVMTTASADTPAEMPVKTTGASPGPTKTAVTICDPDRMGARGKRTNADRPGSSGALVE